MCIIAPTKEKNVGAHDCARIKLNNIGEIVERELLRTEIINTNIKLCAYVIMPDHIHLIINICTSRAQSCAPTKCKTIGNIIRGIKSSITAKIGYSIWQRNYYEHIIRNEKEYYKILQYIKYNPIKWIKTGMIMTRTKM